MPLIETIDNCVVDLMKRLATIIAYMTSDTMSNSSNSIQDLGEWTRGYEKPHIGGKFVKVLLSLSDGMGVIQPPRTKQTTPGESEVRERLSVP